METVMEGR